MPNTGQGSVVVSGGRVFVASHAPTDGDAADGKSETACLQYSDARIYARTMKELICLGTAD